MLGKIGWRRLVAVLGIVTMCTVNIGNDYTSMNVVNATEVTADAPTEGTTDETT